MRPPRRAGRSAHRRPLDAGRRYAGRRSQVERLAGPVKLDDVLKLTSLAAGLLYVLLFLGYRSYYRPLGLDPEDVGITNTFILVRAVGFVSAMICLGGAIWLLRLVSLQFISGWSSRDLLLWAGQLTLCGIYFAYAEAILPPSWPKPAAAVAAMAPAILSLGAAMLHHAGKVLLGSIAALIAITLVTLLIPYLALTTRGRDMAQSALAGHPVQPFSLLGLPLLDVAADPVRVYWIGTPEQRPALLAPNPRGIDGLMLGRGSGTVAVLVKTADANAIVTLPSALVVLQSR